MLALCLWLPAIGAAQPAPQPAPGRARRGDTASLPPMTTDRPGLGDSADVVERGVWQLETGISLASDRTDDEPRIHELAAPLALLRVGVAPRVELRVEADGLVSDTSSVAGARRHSGRSDLEVSLKWRLFDEDRDGIDLALIPLVSLPAGSDGFSSGGYDPGIKLAWTRDLPEDFELSGNVNVLSSTDDHRRFLEQDLSASLAHDVFPGWQGFVEVFSASALSRDGGRAWVLDTGVTHLLGGHVQIDLTVGRGLSPAAPDWFVGGGVCVRGLFVR